MDTLTANKDLAISKLSNTCRLNTFYLDALNQYTRSENIKIHRIEYKTDEDTNKWNAMHLIHIYILLDVFLRKNLNLKACAFYIQHFVNYVYFLILNKAYLIMIVVMIINIPITYITGLLWNRVFKF